MNMKKKVDYNSIKPNDDLEMVTVDVHSFILELNDAISMKNLRDTATFLGIDEEKPFTLPSLHELMFRLRYNAIYFATNYSILTMIVSAITILLSPLFVFVVICIMAAFNYLAYMEKKEKHEGFHVYVFGQRTTSKQRSSFVMLFSFASIFIFGEAVVLSIIASSLSLILIHASLRTYQMPELGEMEFLKYSNDGDDIVIV